VPQRTTTTHHPSYSSPIISTGYSNYNRVETRGGSTSSSSSKLRQEQILIQQRQKEEWKRLHPLPVKWSICFNVAHSTKGLLHRLLPDVWIHTNAILLTF